MPPAVSAVYIEADAVGAMTPDPRFAELDRLIAEMPRGGRGPDREPRRSHTAIVLAGCGEMRRRYKRYSGRGWRRRGPGRALCPALREYARAVLAAWEMRRKQNA